MDPSGFGLIVSDHTLPPSLNSTEQKTLRIPRDQNIIQGLIVLQRVVYLYNNYIIQQQGNIHTRLYFQL